LQQVYPSEDRFPRIVRYVAKLVNKAKLVIYRDGVVRAAAIPAETKEHLLWCLGAMFEPELADVWDEFVDAPKRIRRLGPFIKKQINAMGLERATVFDAATGTGVESIYLLEQGHDVASNEIEPRLIAHAQEAAASVGVPLALMRYDWRHLEHLGPPEQYDLVLALGNSLSCLPSIAEVRNVLSRFAYLLRPNGRLIIDERNYPLIFARKRDMSRQAFRFPPNVVYCSSSIQARPAYIPDEPGNGELLVLEYLRTDGTPVGEFKVLPFAEDALRGLLGDTGFDNVDKYYNLRIANGVAEDSEFVTYVARRTFVESGVGTAREFESVIAFTEITGATPLKRKLGQERYESEWRKHDAKVRAAVKKWRGRIANDTGDGFLIAFDASTDAVSCTNEIRHDSGSEVLPVRIGISKGKVSEDDHGNIRGHEVDAADRICATAKPDRLVVDDRVRLDVDGYDWLRVEHDLRGVGARQLWQLDD
jgi:class 3 adenylate cyclase